MANPRTETAVGESLPLVTILAYCAPALGAGFMLLLLPMYLIKYATDVLLISPAVMGLIFGVSRLWDAMAGPIAGHLSDRTRSSLGRRRPWMLASALPVALAYGLVWTPPAGLGEKALAAWMAIAVLGFYTATTWLIVPHTALGAELTQSYHDRTRLFGFRQIAWSAGGIAALAAMSRFTSGAVPQRVAALDQAVVASLLTASGTLVAVLLLRERDAVRRRASSWSAWSAYRDVLLNPHARLILFVYLIENVGGATITILTPYVAPYIVGRPELTPFFMVCYFVPTLVSVPLWVWLSRRYGKKKLWLFSMWVAGLAFGALFFLDRGTVGLLALIAIVGGAAGGCGAVVAPSLQADCIDWDEYVTGERKEGAYFAAGNVMLKAAFGITSLWTGLALELSGFRPSVEQGETTQLTLRILYSLVPLACYALGASLFARFGLGELQHVEIRRALEERAERSVAAASLPVPGRT